MEFESQYDSNQVFGDFYDGNGNRAWTKMQMRPHSSSHLYGRKDPGRKIKNYDGKIEYNALVEYIVKVKELNWL